MGTVAEGAKDLGKKAAKIMLKEEDYARAAKFYNELPFGAQVVAETAALAALPPGMRLAKGAVTAKPIPHSFKSPLADVKAKYYTDSSGAASAGETSGLTTSMFAKAEHKVPIAEVAGFTEKPGLIPESSGYFTAKEKIVDNPYLTKHYIREIEDITKLSLPEQQLSHLKNALQTQAFSKLDPITYKAHRKDFNNTKNQLRIEWEQNTGQIWPVYTSHPDFSRINKPYDAHHIIQLDHGGPNTWWNIHPADGAFEHKLIHGSGSKANEIFKPKKQ